MRELAIAVLIAACGAQPAPRASELHATTTTSCPASYAQAKGPCDGTNTVTTCGYQEGTCTCEVAGEPEGPAGALRTPDSAPPDPGPPPQAEWHCTAPPPAVRADGCPGTPPTGQCSRDGQQCSYGETCAVQYACVDRTWLRLRQDCPP